MTDPSPEAATGEVAPIRLAVEQAPRDKESFQFTRSFRVGRTQACEVCIPSDYVSREHLEVFVKNGEWWIRDLDSSNGTYVEEQRVQSARVGRRLTCRLGILGPELSFAVETPAKLPVPNIDSKDIDHYIDHYLGGTARGSAGDHTMMVRKAYGRIRKRQRRRYGVAFSLLVSVLIAVAIYAFEQHQQVAKQKIVATDLFYSIKSLDLEIMNLERLVSQSDNKAGARELNSSQDRRKEMSRNYDRYLNSLHVYDQKFTPEQRLILRVARQFGECEIDMPPEFMTEVSAYIRKWQSTSRFKKAIQYSESRGFTKLIGSQLIESGLPPQFFYLAMQESDFDPQRAGPETRMGIAKGMWQFIPETAAKYGLRVGPLAAYSRPDPDDDRNEYHLETRAAVRYLKDLYSTDAQASGLLVAACYNWGELSVLPLVSKLPANPRDRNFWRLLATYPDKIPPETYNYVFYIVSAAVIGEDPRQFGFDFDNPLGAFDNR